MHQVGVPVAGRRLFDVGGWGETGQPWGVPVFVVTHSVPEGRPRADAPVPFTFVTDGVASAVDQARATPGDGWVGVAGPNIVQQCLDAGLLDEVRVNLVTLPSRRSARAAGPGAGAAQSRRTWRSARESR
jgi:dihydrofolate reductase